MNRKRGLPHLTMGSQRILFSLVFALCLIGTAAIRPMAVHGQSNLDFDAALPGATQPSGWTIRPLNGASAELDTETVWQGNRSLHVSHRTSNARTFAGQSVPADSLGRRVRLSAMIQTGPSGDGSAHLLLRADRNRKTLSIQRLREGAPGPGTGWQRFSIDLIVPPRADSVAIGLYVTGTIDAWFDDMRVTTWGEEDLSPPAPEVARYTEEVLDLMENRSVRRETIDWSRLRDEVQRMLLGAETTADAYPAITYAVRLLDDDHSAFLTPARVQQIMPKLKGRVSASPDSEISAEAVRGEILSSSDEDTAPMGYVLLPAFGGASADLQQAYADSVAAALRRVQDSEPCGWVVDARSFSGGNMWPALAGLGPLLGEGTVLQLANPDSTTRDIVYRNGRIELAGTPVLRVERPAPVSSEQPVAVLFGPRTGSSGEAVVIAFRGRPQTHSFGQPSAGFATSNDTFPLSDGAVLNLTTNRIADRTGTVHNQQLRPDTSVPPQASSQQDAALSAARSWLAGECRPATASGDLH